MNPLLLDTLQRASARLKTPLWLVGGPVRDERLGLPCEDWDMACRGAKRIAKEVTRQLKAKCITLDEQYQIFRVILPEAFKPVHTLDFAELQGQTIETDLARRDFTINAMARPLTPTLSLGGEREIIDPFGGQRDLKKRVLKAVSEKAFVEDPLRLLRAYRFAAQFHLTLERRTQGWIQKHQAKLRQVSPERIREELLRLWKQPASTAALLLMDKAKLLSQIFPEMEACRRTAIRYYGKGGVLKHSFETVENLEWIFEQFIGKSREPRSETRKLRTERRLSVLSSRLSDFSSTLSLYLQTPIGGYPRTAWLKWGAFLHDIGKPATAKMFKGRLRFFEHEHVGADAAIRVSERLRCSRQERQLVGLWVRNHMRTGSLAAAPHITDKALSRFFRDLGEEGVGMVLVSLADHYTYLAKSKWGKGTDPVEKMALRLLSAYYEQRARLLPARVVDGHELMKALKIKPGPLIGQLLSQIQDAQADGKVTTKEDALAYARKCQQRRT